MLGRPPVPFRFPRRPDAWLTPPATRRGENWFLCLFLGPEVILGTRAFRRFVRGGRAQGTSPKDPTTRARLRTTGQPRSLSTDCGIELAWASIAVPACTRMLNLA